ncbi:reverse transcriptase domain-containing protein [Tanacetum coccineum]
MPSNTVPNPREDLKAITTRSGATLAGPSVPPPPLSSSKEVDQEQTSFAEAIAHMPKFTKMVKSLLTNKEKLLELANTPLNENCSAVLLKKLPEKLGDTGRFLIPCDFYGLESCMALADLATWTVAYPPGIAEDVFIQVGKFTFPADFVVVDYKVDPQFPLILGRPFLRMAHALVDVHGKKLTLRFGDEELVFNSINPMSGSPTPSPDLVVESLSPSFTPFGDSDFLLEETDVFLSLDDSIPPGIDNDIYDSKGDILFLEGLINDEIPRDLPPLELNNYPEGDIIFLENLLKDEPLEANKSKINPLIIEPPNTFLMGDEEIILNSHEDIDDLVPIPRVTEKPLNSLDCISKTLEMTIPDPLFDFDSEFTLNLDNPIFGIHNEESDESETETIMNEVQNHSPQSTAQIPPPYEKLNFDLTVPKPILTFSDFRYGIFGSHRVFDILGPRLPFSLSYNFGLVFSKQYLKFLSLNIFLLVGENGVFNLRIIIFYVFSRLWKYST